MRQGRTDNISGQDYRLVRRRLSGRMPPSPRRWPLPLGPDGLACLPPFGGRPDGLPDRPAPSGNVSTPAPLSFAPWPSERGVPPFAGGRD
ncbi:MAG: hypothetical protein ACPG48_04280 [Candidatus Puniceispirillaceae bacterium]